MATKRGRGRNGRRVADAAPVPSHPTHYPRKLQCSMTNEMADAVEAQARAELLTVSAYLRRLIRQTVPGASRQEAS